MGGGPAQLHYSKDVSYSHGLGRGEQDRGGWGTHSPCLSALDTDWCRRGMVGLGVGACEVDEDEGDRGVRGAMGGAWLVI